MAGLLSPHRLDFYSSVDVVVSVGGSDGGVGGGHLLALETVPRSLSNLVISFCSRSQCVKSSMFFAFRGVPTEV